MTNFDFSFVYDLHKAFYIFIPDLMALEKFRCDWMTFDTIKYVVCPGFYYWDSWEEKFIKMPKEEVISKMREFTKLLELVN